MNIFLQGLTMGLAYVAPIGMQNLFVINSALTNKRKRALLTALIVIFFDITLSLACFFGIGTIMQRFKWLQMVILCVGSLFISVSACCVQRHRIWKRISLPCPSKKPSHPPVS